MTNSTNLDYRAGDLERVPRYDQTITTCGTTCIATERCQGFSLKDDGKCYLKGAEYGTVASNWEFDPYTQSSTSVKGCPKPATLLPLRDPFDPPATPAPIAPPAPPSSSNKGLVLGVAIGVALCTLIVIAVVWLLARRCGWCRPSSGGSKSRTSVDDTTDGLKKAAEKLPDGDSSMHMMPFRQAAPSTLPVQSGSGWQSNAAAANAANVFETADYLAVPQDLNIYKQRLDNTSEEAERRDSAHKNTRIDELHAVLDYIAEAHGGEVDGKYVLDLDASRMNGGQAVVAFAKSKFGGSTFAIKFFVDHATYLLEAQIYGLLMWLDTDDSGHFIREVREHDGDILQNGMTMPSYIVMKQGMSMHEWIMKRQPSPMMGMWMLGEICIQVSILHSQGFVHRDLKPGNILWLPEGNSWRLIDMGCVVPIGAEVPPKFTLRFVPPEIAAALNQECSTCKAHPSVDVWAVGVMAFEMITGHSLFPYGSSSNDMRACLTGARPFPHEVDPSVFSKLGRLKKVVQLMLSRDPAMRPSIQEVSSKLDEIAMATNATTSTYTNRRG